MCVCFVNRKPWGSIIHLLLWVCVECIKYGLNEIFRLKVMNFGLLYVECLSHKECVKFGGIK